jgi:hypothetical protein
MNPRLVVRFHMAFSLFLILFVVSAETPQLAYAVLVMYGHASLALIVCTGTAEEAQRDGVL